MQKITEDKQGEDLQTASANILLMLEKITILLISCASFQAPNPLYPQHDDLKGNTEGHRNL